MPWGSIGSHFHAEPTIEEAHEYAKKIARGDLDQPVESARARERRLSLEEYGKNREGRVVQASTPPKKSRGKKNRRTRFGRKHFRRLFLRAVQSDTSKPSSSSPEPQY